MIGKTRKSENHINRLLPRLRCLIGNWKYWSWPEELKSLTRHLGGLRGYIGTKCHRRTDNTGAQLLFVLWYDLMQEFLSDGWWILRGWTSFFNALVRTFVPRWKNWSWERISGYDRNLIFITHDFSYGSPLWFGWLCTNRDRIFLGVSPFLASVFGKRVMWPLSYQVSKHLLLKQGWPWPSWSAGSSSPPPPRWRSPPPPSSSRWRRRSWCSSSPPPLPGSACSWREPL